MSTIPVKIGTIVDVGGCVGLITQVTENLVEVSGVYHYSDGADGGYAEPWNFYYSIEEFSKISEFSIRRDRTVWDATNLEPWRD